MAKVYCFITLLFCCLQAAAQNDIPAKKDSLKKKGESFEELKNSLPKNNPLYLLNGEDIRDSISKERFGMLKSEDITSIDVIKDESASAIWGKRGAKGVVIVYTKNEVKNKPLPPYSATRSISSINTSFPLYIINGKPVPDSLSNSKEQVLKTLSPMEIFSVSVLKYAEGTALYGSRGVNGVIIIITDSYAVRQYQDKLMGFSNNYADYIKRNSRNDHKITYVLDGRKLTGERKEKANILYDLPIGKIKKVTFVDNSKSSGNLSSILTINTK